MQYQLRRQSNEQHHMAKYDLINLRHIHFEAVLKNFKLKHTYGTDYEGIKGAWLFKDLNSSFLSQLSHTFLELFTFHSIFWGYAGKEFRREYREVTESYFVFCAQSVSPTPIVPASKTPIISPGYASSTMVRSVAKNC